MYNIQDNGNHLLNTPNLKLINLTNNVLRTIPTTFKIFNK